MQSDRQLNTSHREKERGGEREQVNSLERDKKRERACTTMQSPPKTDIIFLCEKKIT